MLTVDPWHWLTEDGSFLFDNPRLYRRMAESIANYARLAEAVGKAAMR
jgi:hypothetical protein